jgi:pimeloyl-ACP methyl ester carboxylesterase
MTTRTRRLARALMTLLLAAAFLATPTTADAQTSGFPSVGTNFAQRGPYQVSTMNGSQHTYWYPTNLRSTGLQHPVVLWGNGTGAEPANYAALLSHLASHGFVVAAANTPNAGSGSEMLAGLNNLESFDRTSSSPFYGAVDTESVVTSGHSQGGVGALASSRDARVDATMPVEGAFSANGGNVPTLFLAGEDDTIATPSQIYDTYESASTIPAAYVELANATHFTPANDGGYFPAVTTAWARWHLMGDENAKGWFVGAGGLGSQSQISQYEVNARFSATYGGGGGGGGGDEVCVRSSTRDHVSADRAVSIWGRAYARGSGDSLGRVSSFVFVSLEETAPGNWVEVSGC